MWVIRVERSKTTKRTCRVKITVAIGTGDRWVVYVSLRRILSLYINPSGPLLQQNKWIINSLWSSEVTRYKKLHKYNYNWKLQLFFIAKYMEHSLGKDTRKTKNKWTNSFEWYDQEHKGLTIYLLIKLHIDATTNDDGAKQKWSSIRQMTKILLSSCARII